MNEYLVTITDEHGTTRRTAFFREEYAQEFRDALDEMIEDGILNSASVEKLDEAKENESL